MGKKIHSIILFHLLFFYGIAILFYNSNSLPINPNFGKTEGSNQQSNFELNNIDFFYHIIPSENITNPNLTSPLFSYKNLFEFSPFSLLHKIELHSSSFTLAYIFQFEDSRINISIPDILFPFHYFT